MRSVVWTGHLHFGLVVLPVRLLVAARAETTRFKRIHRRRSKALVEFSDYESEGRRKDGDLDPDGDGIQGLVRPFEDTPGILQSRSQELRSHEYFPVRQVLESQKTGEEIKSDELVKGYEYAPNQFAFIDPAEIQRASVETSDAIDLFHFVNAEDVDPVYFERSYYVAPESGGEKAYSLLLDVMRRENKFGIARVGMHRREHILILRATEKCIIAHTMFYANEVRSAPKINSDPGLFTEREISVASALLREYSGVFEPEDFKDLYQARIKNIIESHLATTERQLPDVSLRSPGGPPDLMQSIRLSLKQIESRNRGTQAQARKLTQSASAPSKKKPRKATA